MRALDSNGIGTEFSVAEALFGLAEADVAPQIVNLSLACVAGEGLAPMSASRSFALYWSSSTISYLGDGVRFAAVPLLAAALSSSPREVAMVAAAAWLPWLLFGLIAGVVVDRIERMPAMAVLQAARGALTLILILGLVTNTLSMGLLVGFVFLLNSCEVVFDIAAQAILPALVHRDRLQWANSRLITAEVLTFEFIGPALGGVLFAVSVAGAFALDAASFVVSGVILLALSRVVRGTRASAGSDAEGSVPLRVELIEGLRWFRKQPLIRSLTAITVAVNLAAGGFYAVLALFTREELLVGPIGYGLLIAASAVGSVTAGLTSGRVTSGRDRRKVAFLAAPAVCLCFAVLAGIPWLPVAVLVMVAFGLAVSLYTSSRFRCGRASLQAACWAV